MRLAILGASARAAAFSALDAGFDVVAADLFADADLAARCPATQIADWPGGFACWLGGQKVDGWLFTGGVENFPDEVDQLASAQPLLGNGGDVLRRVRSASVLEQILGAAGCPFPETQSTAPQRSSKNDWLAKSSNSAGGLGVQVSCDAQRSAPASTYFQRRIVGKSISAAYVAANGRSMLLGVTEQIIGRAWTRAAPFQYAGSIGPLDLEYQTLETIRQAGDALARACPLQGLFGIDFVVDSAGTSWLVDVNPRYTASMEVVERVIDCNMIELHVAASRGLLPNDTHPRIRRQNYGKAYLFAREAVSIGTLAACGLADVPPKGTKIAKHAPVATVFAEGYDTDEVEASLRRRLQQLEKEVYS